jgi:hypothetical protein
LILPVKGLRAKDLPLDLLPNKQILEAYRAVGREADVLEDRTGYERNWNEFCVRTTANKRLKEQLIDQKISNLMRVRDAKGEYLVYDVGMRGYDYQGNVVDFSYHEGRLSRGNRQGLPVFKRIINPETDEVVSDATQIDERKPVYTVPFSKEKVNELSEFLTEQHQFTLQMPDGRRETCSQKEFTDMSYDELVDWKQGLTEYARHRREQAEQFKKAWK